MNNNIFYSTTLNLLLYNDILIISRKLYQIYKQYPQILSAFSITISGITYLPFLKLNLFKSKSNVYKKKIMYYTQLHMILIVRNT